MPITNSYELDGLGFEFFRGKILVVCLNRPHWDFVQSCLLFNGFRGSFPGVNWAVREGGVGTRWRSISDVKMSGVITLNKVSFHGVNMENLTVYTHMNVCISTAECTK